MNIKKLNQYAKTPTRGSEWAAGYDLYAAILDDSVTIPPHSTAMIGTGLAIEVPINAFGGIFARSGLASKMGLRPANCVGVVDSDYRGEVIVALHNDTDEPRIVVNGERIAQLVVIPFVQIDSFVEVDELSSTERGVRGWGSTGMN